MRPVLASNPVTSSFAPATEDETADTPDETTETEELTTLRRPESFEPGFDDVGASGVGVSWAFSETGRGWEVEGAGAFACRLASFLTTSTEA